MDFPIVREKKMGTTTGTRVLCTQYLLRVATYGSVLSAIVDYSSNGATYLGLWAHLQQPLATTAGLNNS